MLTTEPISSNANTSVTGNTPTFSIISASSTQQNKNAISQQTQQFIAVSSADNSGCIAVNQIKLVPSSSTGSSGGSIATPKGHFIFSAQGGQGLITTNSSTGQQVTFAIRAANNNGQPQQGAVQFTVKAPQTLVAAGSNQGSGSGNTCNTPTTTNHSQQSPTLVAALSAQPASLNTSVEQSNIWSTSTSNTKTMPILLMQPTSSSSSLTTLSSSSGTNQLSTMTTMSSLITTTGRASYQQTSNKITTSTQTLTSSQTLSSILNATGSRTPPPSNPSAEGVASSSMFTNTASLVTTTATSSTRTETTLIGLLSPTKSIATPKSSIKPLQIKLITSRAPESSTSLTTTSQTASTTSSVTTTSSSQSQAD